MTFATFALPMNFTAPDFSCSARGSMRTFSMFVQPESMVRTRNHAPSCPEPQPHGKYSELLPGARRDISDILCAVWKSLLVASLVAAAAVFAFQPLSTDAQAPPAPATEAAQATAPAGPVIVLDPPHGGTDTGGAAKRWSKRTSCCKSRERFAPDSSARVIA